MSYQHRELAAGRWATLSLVEQMANIGSEVERALNWQAKNNLTHCMKAFDRALELMDLSLDTIKNYASLKELARVRELLVDFFLEDNKFMSSPESWRRYFLAFAVAVRRNR